MKLFKSIKNKLTKGKNGENMPHLEIAEVFIALCNIANNNCQQNSRVLYTCFSNELFRGMLHVSTTNLIILKTFNSQFSYIEVWFTDQNYEPQETADKGNISFAINWSVKYKKRCSIQFNPEMLKNLQLKNLHVKESAEDTIKTASNRAT